MRSLTVLVDMDDVMWDLVGVWVAELNQRYGTSVNFEDITDWNIAKFFPELTSSELFTPLYDPLLWAKLQPMDHAFQVMKRLIDDGHKIRPVTATHYRTVEPKMKRFLELYSYLKWEDVIIASDKSLIKGDVMIDDGTHNLETTSCAKILFDRPHNRSYNAERNDMSRAHDWDEIYQLVTEIAGGIE